MFIQTLFFYIFAIWLIIAALAVITARNPVHAVLCLIFAFFNVAGLFILLGAEFLAMTLVIVYVGAVAVLFLFIVMMLNINFVKMREGFIKNIPATLMICLVFLIDLLLALNKTDFQITKNISYPITSNISNAHAIGLVLYTEYFVAFVMAGIVLFLAMIGAIALTHQKRSNVLRQNVNQQLSRKPHEAIEIANPPSGKGINQWNQ